MVVILLIPLVGESVEQEAGASVPSPLSAVGRTFDWGLFTLIKVMNPQLFRRSKTRPSRWTILFFVQMSSSLSGKVTCTLCWSLPVPESADPWIISAEWVRASLRTARALDWGTKPQSWPQGVTNKREHALKTAGIRRNRLPFAKSSVGGPWPVDSYRNNLNQGEVNSGSGGPQKGGSTLEPEEKKTEKKGC